MVTLKEIAKCYGKHINLYFKDGEFWENVFCDGYYQAEDEGWEHALEFGNIEVAQSEIERIEILD